MMYMRVEINSDLGLTVRGQRAALKSTWDETGKLWQREFLPKHFKSGATSRYGYQHRTIKTVERKRWLASKGKVEDGGNTPLVWSGLMRRSMLGFRQRQAAYPTRVTINLVGPSYLSINYKPGRPHYAKEILTVNSEERREIDRFMQQTIREKSLEQFRLAKSRKTIRS